MKLLLSFLLYFILIMGLASCASEYAYNYENPEAYKKHWENSDPSKDNEILYLFSEECKENKEKACF